MPKRVDGRPCPGVAGVGPGGKRCSVTVDVRLREAGRFNISVVVQGPKVAGWNYGDSFDQFKWLQRFCDGTMSQQKVIAGPVRCVVEVHTNVQLCLCA